MISNTQKVSFLISCVSLHFPYILYGRILTCSFAAPCLPHQHQNGIGSHSLHQGMLHCEMTDDRWQCQSRGYRGGG